MVANRIKWLKLVLQDYMSETKQKKIKTDFFTFSYVTNGGPIPIEIVDREAIPAEFFDPQPPRPNIARIREELLKSGEVPGVVEKPRGHQVRIK